MGPASPTKMSSDEKCDCLGTASLHLNTVFLILEPLFIYWESWWPLRVDLSTTSQGDMVSEAGWRPDGYVSSLEHKHKHDSFLSAGWMSHLFSSFFLRLLVCPLPLSLLKPLPIDCMKLPELGAIFNKKSNPRIVCPKVWFLLCSSYW